MVINPVAATQAAQPFTPPTIDATSATGAAGTPATGTSSFASSLDQVSQLNDQANQLASQVATGSIDDIHQFTLAASKASLAVELTASIRNRAVEAYQDIMRMQV